MALGNLAPSEDGRLNVFGFCYNYLSGAVPVPLRTGVTLDSPTSEGYDPVACQLSGGTSPTTTTTTTTAAPTTTTTTTSTAAPSTTTTAVAGVYVPSVDVIA